MFLTIIDFNLIATIATQLGSNIVFTEQTTSISEYIEIEIIRQNFGGDLSAGITEVSLDLNEPHYWMEVRKIKLTNE